MARPERNSVDYFPFLCEEGEKMFYLEQTYGNDGFATFVKILRELARKDYHYINLSEQSSRMFLAAKCRISIELLDTIITDLVMLGKFDKKLWDSKIIWCQDFIDSIQDAYKKRNNKCITYDGLVIRLQGLGVLKLSKKKPKEPLKPHSIVDDSKEDEIIVEDTPTYLEFESYALSKKNVSKQDLKLKYDAWVENGWKDGNDKKIKNWKSKLLNTIRYFDEVKNNGKLAVDKLPKQESKNNLIL